MIFVSIMGDQEFCSIIITPLQKRYHWCILTMSGTFGNFQCSLLVFGQTKRTTENSSIGSQFNLDTRRWKIGTMSAKKIFTITEANVYCPISTETLALQHFLQCILITVGTG